MKVKMGELNLEEHGDKTMKEIIENVILPDIKKDKQKDSKNRIENRKPETYGELIEILKKEHEETFKDVTLEAQLDKFVDEQKEFKQAENCLEKARELADMFIVAAGIARFAPEFVEEFIVPTLVDKIDEQDEYGKGLVTYLALEKSLINKERKWSNKGGKWQHK